MIRSLTALALAVGVAGIALPSLAQAPAAVPEVEEPEILTMAKPTPRWVFVDGGWSFPSYRIFDGDSGAMQGVVQGSRMSNFAFDPKGRYFYVAETLWSHGNRGKRDDLLAVYDAKTLKLVREIPLPGRMLVTDKVYNLSVSADGRFAYVFNMDPATSIVTVDLDRGSIKIAEIPGCGLAFPAPDGAVSSLCTDGSLATAQFGKGGKPSVTRSEPFFNAENDPIFDNVVIDVRGGRATFLTYSGLLISAKLGARPEISAPWSIQQAAGMKAPGGQPREVAWLPGGKQPLAVHAASGKIFVLMHTGEFWSQKAEATEVWILDGTTQKLIARKRLEEPANMINVSQDAEPLIYLGHEGTLRILDSATFEVKHEIAKAGGSVILTPGT